MAKDFIKIDTSIAAAKFSQELVVLIRDVRAVLDRGDKLKGIMDHNIEGADYADVETLFGLPTGNGDETYNLLAGSLAALKGTAQSADALTLIDRVG